MENLGGKIQFMIWKGALVPWALFHQLFLLLDFKILDFYAFSSSQQSETKSNSKVDSRSRSNLFQDFKI
jgi:hypothetical protein